MLETLIHSLEIISIALVSFLLLRLYKLNNAESELVTVQVDNAIQKAIFASKKSASNSEYEGKMESLKQAQMFVGVQLIDVKREFPDLRNSGHDWLTEAICYYLIGAIDFIGKQGRCSIKNRKDMISIVLKTNLKLSSDDAARFFNEALNRQSQSDSDQMVRSGARAAKAWLKDNTVPNDFSLRCQLDGWGVFA